jgi:hypothetical protein
LVIFAQGEKMINSNFTPINSILEIKSSGQLSVAEDLNMEDGKTIAELLYEEKKDTQKDPK